MSFFWGSHDAPCHSSSLWNSYYTVLHTWSAARIFKISTNISYEKLWGSILRLYHSQYQISQNFAGFHALNFSSKICQEWFCFIIVFHFIAASCFQAWVWENPRLLWEFTYMPALFWGKNLHRVWLSFTWRMPSMGWNASPAKGDMLCSLLYLWWIKCKTLHRKFRGHI